MSLWGPGGALPGELLLLDGLNATRLPLGQPIRMTFIFLGLCTGGSATYLLNTHEQRLTAGDLLVVTANSVVEMLEVSADLDGLCMAVTEEFFREIMRDVSDVASLLLFTRRYPVTALRHDEAQTFRDYFDVLRQKIGDVDHGYRRELLRTLMLAMFYDLSNVIRRTQTDATDAVHHSGSRPDAVFARFLQLVETHAVEERRVSWYAQQLCLSPKYLSEIIKRASGRTPNDWIDNYVMLHLQVLLKNTTYSIKEICKLMHFPNQSFLGKYFKDHVGISPSQYRRAKK